MMEFREALTFDDIQIVPIYSEVNSRNDCLLDTRFTRNYNIKRPYVSSPMDTVSGREMAIRMMELGGVGCIHRFMSIDEQISILKDVFDRREELKLKDFPICVAVGVKVSLVDIYALVDAGANVILIDVAHGNTILVKDTIKLIKENFKEVDVIAGNVATREGARNLCEWGADAIRVGIGNGSLCSTRITTGIGIPQVTALIDTIEVSKEYNVPVIADGGIRMVGDVAKALSLGSESVMLGSLLSGTKESPGTIEKMGTWPSQQLYKKYRGSASLETKREHNLDIKNVEGDSTLVMYTGGIKRILNDIDDGVRSSMSYVNSINLKEFREKSNFVKVTQNGTIEASPHKLRSKGLI